MGMADALVLDDVPEGVWRAFQEDDLRRHTAAWAHDAHLARWRRSRALGASSDGAPVDDALVRGEDLKLRAEHVEMLDVLGASALARATAQVSAHDFVLLLADADGVVVRSAGGGDFRTEAERVRLIEGASWGEPVRGTNAIGTAASEGRPTIVLGRAHYGRSYHRLACYAAPVLDPSGRVAAVLDATSTIEHATPQVGDAVFAAAGALTELLRLEAYASAGGAMLRVLSRALDRSDAPAMLVEPPGRITRMNASARTLLSGAPAGGQARALIGLDWATLEAEAFTPTAGGRPIGPDLRAHVEPLVGASGAPLALIVHLEPRSSSTPRPAPPRPPQRRASVPFAEIVCEDPTLTDAIEWARLVAASELPVMLLAETGAGKELFAKAIHAASPRAAGPFVAVNCGAIAPSLLESELFGYAPGAFTGADKRGRPGLFHAASGGTLFLDEVAEMPLAMQAALLRVLESGRYQRVGDTRPEESDVRVVCATCRDLEGAIEAGTFRRDLYYRLKGAALRIPALRDREDVIPLARALLAQRAARLGLPAPTLSIDAERAIAAHDWPGNVRELISTLDVALVAARGAPELDASHLPIDPPERPEPPRGGLLRAEAEALRAALAKYRGNVSAAARELGIARSTLYRLARRAGVSIR